MPSLPEGLEEKGGSCARVLSVAGLFALMRRFPGIPRFILRVKRGDSLRAEPLLFNTMTKSVKPAHTPLVHRTVVRRQHLHRVGWYTYKGRQGGIYTRWWGYTLGWKEAYTRVLTSQGGWEALCAEDSSLLSGKLGGSLRRVFSLLLREAGKLSAQRYYSP